MLEEVRAWLAMFDNLEQLQAQVSEVGLAVRTVRTGRTICPRGGQRNGNAVVEVDDRAARFGCPTTRGYLISPNCQFLESPPSGARTTTRYCSKQAYLAMRLPTSKDASYPRSSQPMPCVRLMNPPALRLNRSIRDHVPHKWQTLRAGIRHQSHRTDLCWETLWSTRVETRALKNIATCEGALDRAR